MDTHPPFRRGGPIRLSDNELIQQAKWLHENGYPAHAQSWSTNGEHIPQIGRSPSALYKRIGNRVVEGRKFMGHGSFDGFKRNVLGIAPHAPDHALTQMDSRQLQSHVKQLAEAKPPNRRKPSEKSREEKNQDAEALLSAHKSGDVSREQVLTYLFYEHHNLDWSTIRRMLDLRNIDAVRRLIAKTNRFLQRSRS